MGDFIFQNYFLCLVLQERIRHPAQLKNGFGNL